MCVHERNECGDSLQLSEIVWFSRDDMALNTYSAGL